VGPTRRRFLVAYGIWVYVIVAYFVPGATWNPVSRFALTRAIVEHHGFSIDGFEDSTGDRARRGDHWYSDKAPIPSLFAAPALGVFELFDHAIAFEPAGPEGSVEHFKVNRACQIALWVCSLATAGIATAILAVLVFVALRGRTTPMGALVCSAITVLATPIFPYGTSFYGHAIAALFLFAAVVVAASEEPSRTSIRVAGACIAVAAGCEYLTLVPGLLIAAFMLRRGSIRQTVVDLAAGAALPALLVGVYHAICFGAPWRTGYSYLVRSKFVAGHAHGLLGIHVPRFVPLMGLLLGPRRGLFYVAPVTLAGVVGLAIEYRRGDRASRIAVTAAAAMLLLNAGYYMWWGGAAAGPRHLVPVLPMLAFGFAAVWRRPYFRWFLGVAGIASFALLVALVAVGLEAPEYGNVFTSYVFPSLARGRIARIPGASNVGLLLGLSARWSLLPVLGWTFGGFAWLSRKVNE
jgi:hypothetical protein